jgi:hypothetical protein
MQGNSTMHTSCGECGGQVPEQAEICPDCGYPVATLSPTEFHPQFTTSLEHALMLALGIAVTAVGVLALLAKSPLGASLAIPIGVGCALSALLGLWRNLREN